MQQDRQFAIEIPTRDRAWLAEVAPEHERQRIEMWRQIVTCFMRAENKCEAVEFLLAEYGDRTRISQATIYNHVKAVQREGWVGLMRKRWRNRFLSETNSANEFEAFTELLWKPLCEQSQRKNAAAYRVLFREHLCAGRIIPGYDTDWRGIWMLDHKKLHMRPPERCPYEMGKCVPRGWGLRNLNRYAPDAFELTAARQGMGNASAHLPKLPTSRAYLPFASVIEMDDMFHDVETRLLGNRLPQIVVELRALELKTGCRWGWGAKPVRERDDGTREHIREAFTRYLMADILCNRGYHHDGLLVCGELGTARLSDDLLHAIERWAGKDQVTFSGGAIVDGPLAKGLYGGRGRGNFRFKAHIESAWNLIKNELAMLPGQKGADPDHAPEALERKVRHDRELMKICNALCRERPDLVEDIRGMFPPYYKYIEAVMLINERIDRRTDHQLEGFEECGFVKSMFRLHEGDAWKPESMLERMDPDDAANIRAIISRAPRKYSRLFVMSPAEAVEYCMQRCELVRLPSAAVPDILGRDLADDAVVRDDDTIYIDDKYLPQKRYPVAAIVRTIDDRKKLLPRGSRWLVHINPFTGTEAYISTPDGRYVGMAPVMVAGSRIDRDAINRNLGIIQAVKAREVKRLAPFVDGELERMYEDARHDITVITGSDPVDDAQADADLRGDAIARARAAGVDIAELYSLSNGNSNDDSTGDASTEPAAATAGRLSDLLAPTTG